MRSIRVLAITGAAATLVGAVAMAPAQASSQGPAKLPGFQVPVFAGPASKATSVVRDSSTGAKKAATATFVVTYHGFTEEAKAAFQRAVDEWSTEVVSDVPITVDATWTALAPGVLGSAGPSYLFQSEKTGNFDVDAIANMKAGKDLDPSADIVARFSSAFSNWHLGTDPAPLGKYDLESVVAHELGHGLGFLGAGQYNPDAGTGSVQFQGINVRYDRFTRLGIGGRYLWKMPNDSTQLGSALVSDNVYFDSPKVRAANGGQAAKLYTPTAWRSGSSYSHLDEATYGKGNVNSLMTPQIGDGETIRSAGPVTLAIFQALGW